MKPVVKIMQCRRYRFNRGSRDLLLRNGKLATHSFLTNILAGKFHGQATQVIHGVQTTNTVKRIICVCNYIALRNSLFEKLGIFNTIYSRFLAKLSFFMSFVVFLKISGTKVLVTMLLHFFA